MAKKEKCFVMMSFATPEKYKDTDHFDKVYEQIFVPAIEKAGYEPYRVDENKICDSIIGKIFEAVRTTPMALCDLSNKNPNVLYELGLRQAYDMPVVLVQDDITDRIFDVSGISTVTYSSHRLVENVNDAIEAISEAIIQTKEGNESTLVKIVKAKGADYDSIEVTGNDNTNIMLNTILNDIKDIKNNYKEKCTITYQEHESNNASKPLLREHVIELSQGITNKFIDITLENCATMFGVEIRMRMRNENIIHITFNYENAMYSYNYIDNYLNKKLGKKE